MDSARFEQLLKGEVPSGTDFVAFVHAIHSLPSEILWGIINLTPHLNGILRKVVMSSLQTKVVRKQLDNLRF